MRRPCQSKNSSYYKCPAEIKKDDLLHQITPTFDIAPTQFGRATYLLYPFAPDVAQLVDSRNAADLVDLVKEDDT